MRQAALDSAPLPGPLTGRVLRYAPGAHPGRHLDSRLRRAVEYLEANFRYRISVAEVALEAGVHPSYLAELFRAGLSVSVGEWVRNRRLEYARAALRDQSAPISRVALQAGFADHSHLTRLFRMRYGMTPVEYRRIVGSG